LLEDELCPDKIDGWTATDASPALLPQRGEQVASRPLSPKDVREREERARELRLYAARLEILDGCSFGKPELIIDKNRRSACLNADKAKNNI